MDDSFRYAPTDKQASLKRAFQGWVYFEPHASAGQDFFDRVHNATRSDFSTFFDEGILPSRYAASMYDAITLFATVANQQSWRPDQGGKAFVTQSIANMSFEGTTGLVKLASNGDLLLSYQVLNLVNGAIVVGVFWARNQSYSSTGTAIIWPGGVDAVPADMRVSDGLVECPFGGACSSSQAMVGAVASVGGILLLLGSFAVWAVWIRRWDEEKKLATWRESECKSLVRLWDERTSSFTAQLVTAASCQGSSRGSMWSQIASKRVPVSLSKAQTVCIDAVDIHGYIPLHYAVSAKADVRMVEALMDAFPSGPSISDAKKNLALHLAVTSQADVAVVQSVYSAYPDAALAANGDGKMPVELLAARYCGTTSSNWTAPDEQVIVELTRLLAFPLDCQGRADNWFHLLQLEDEQGFDGAKRRTLRTRWSSVTQMAAQAGVVWARRPNVAEGTECSRLHKRTARNHVGMIGRLVLAVLDMARERSVTVDTLAYAIDAKGRRAIDVATRSNKRLLWQRLFLLGRYAKCRLLHQSNTSRVWEVEDKEVEDEGLRSLALKQVGCELSFAREISLRTRHRLSNEFVVQVIREHPADLIFLMPHCDCSLEHALCTENFAGRSADLVRSIAKQLVVALMHIHTAGVVHGDLKAKNACRLRGVWKLIDFDAAAAIGGTAGSKITIGQRPANMPPEIARRVVRANFPANVIRARLVKESHDAARVVWEECLAVVEELDREGLDPSVCTLPGVAPSFDMWGLGLILYRLVTAFRLLNSDEHDELDEAQLSDLALWRGVNRGELRKRVFAKAEPGAVTCSEKDAAVELIAACLQPDPAKRPQSIQQLLKFEYFLPRGSGTITAKLLFVSTPGKCFNQRTGIYDFDLMSWLQKLCRHFAGRFVVAYDWAGSSSADARDKQWFDQIFEVRNSEGRTLFEEWITAPPAEKETLIDAVEQILHETRWLASYRGSIKAQIRETCQSGAKAILVRFEGGPVTRVEARIMAQLIKESSADLAQLGVGDPRIELRAFDTVFQFADSALTEVLVEICGDNCEPVPAGLLAELPRAGSMLDPGLRVQWAVGTRVAHPLRGHGRVVKIDWYDPQDRPIHVVFGTGELHHYSLLSAAAKLEQVARAHASSRAA